MQPLRQLRDKNYITFALSVCWLRAAVCAMRFHSTSARRVSEQALCAVEIDKIVTRTKRLQVLVVLVHATQSRRE
jgi:hypothetical protein